MVSVCIIIGISRGPPVRREMLGQVRTTTGGGGGGGGGGRQAAGGGDAAAGGLKPAAALGGRGVKQTLSGKMRSPASHAAIARLAKKQALVGMNVGTHVKGQGYFDAEHKDDKFVPVSDISAAMGEANAVGAKVVGERQESGVYANWDMFVQPTEDDGSSSYVSGNQQSVEMTRDDDFVPPTEKLAPERNVPNQEYMPWQAALRGFLKSILG